MTFTLYRIRRDDGLPFECNGRPLEFYWSIEGDLLRDCRSLETKNNVLKVERMAEDRETVMETFWHYDSWPRTEPPSHCCGAKVEGSRCMDCREFAGAR